MHYNSVFSVFYMNGEIKAIPLIHVTQAIDACRVNKQDFLMHSVAAMDEDTACAKARTSTSFVENILKIIQKDLTVTTLRLSTPQTDQHWVDNVEALARYQYRFDHFSKLLNDTHKPR